MTWQFEQRRSSRIQRKYFLFIVAESVVSTALPSALGVLQTQNKDVTHIAKLFTQHFRHKRRFLLFREHGDFQQSKLLYWKVSISHLKEKQISESFQNMMLDKSLLPKIQQTKIAVTKI